MNDPLGNTYFFRHRGALYPTKKYVVSLHEDVLEISEGRTGIAHESIIESAVHKPVVSAGGTDAYGTFFTKIAATGYTLAHDHGFIDGNERTALQIMLNTLETNGFYPDPTDREKTTAVILAALNLLDVSGLRITLMMWCGIDPSDDLA